MAGDVVGAATQQAGAAQVGGEGSVPGHAASLGWSQG